MARVRLSSLPERRKVYAAKFSRLDGGLNLCGSELRLAANESPSMQNLWWEDGALQSRPGQFYVTAAPSGGGEGFAATDAPFHGRIFLHIGGALYTLPQGVSDRDDAGDALPVPARVADGIPANRGAFVLFGDWLFYKNRGGFFRISYDAASDGFTVSRVADNAFVPTILINADPSQAGAGDAYQPENRLSAQKRVTYNASAAPRAATLTGDGRKRAFSLGVTAADQLRGVSSVYIEAVFQAPPLYEVNIHTGTILFNAAPAKDATITVTLDMGSTTYYLPVPDVDSVDSVKVDGIELTAGTDYTADLRSGVVTFAEAPPVTDPPTNNTVEIVYSKANPEARDAVMNCVYAGVCGADNQLCLVLGGDTGRTDGGGKLVSQPNAVFWSGNTGAGLDPSYWPVTQYNLVGDTEDAVTGFGRQYGDFIVFQARSIGKLTAHVETVDGRAGVALSCQRVNDRTGCDLPGSIRLVENNLVFASTASGGGPGGVFRILSASAAHENNVQRLSRKIDGSLERPGLRYDLTSGGGPVSSLDDGQRYYLLVNGHVWVWDYALNAAEPVWFYWTGFQGEAAGPDSGPARRAAPAAWFRQDGKIFHLNAGGRVTRLGGGVFADYGAAIRRFWRLPVQTFGGFDRLKDVLTLLVSMRADTPGGADVVYETDYETRTDRVPLAVAGYDRLSERNLEERELSVPHVSAVFRRRPLCRHIRHFSLRLENNAAGENLSLYSLEIQYRYLGKER